MTSSDVSVVMTALDAERYLDQALRSAFEQTRPPAVVIVVDDGSTDATADIAEGFDPRVRVLRRPHAGIGVSRNTGIAEVETEYVAFLDADDLWLPAKLERQLDAFAADPTRDAVFCMFDEFLEPGAELPPGTRAPRTGQDAALGTGALLPMELVRRLGPFDAVPVGDWLGWWGRARTAQVHEHVVPEVLYRRRIHGANNSLRRSDNRQFLEIARRHLHERRAQSSDAADR
jgi:glycosyltransferase involved in cell wall biosynthesis